MDTTRRPATFSAAPFSAALARALLPAVALPFAAAADIARAQEFPARPVRIVIGFPAGGPADFFARTLAEPLSKQWAQPVIVDNRAGANGLIAAEFVLRAPADGHSLYLSSAGALVIQQHLQLKMPFETLVDFAPVSHVVSVPELLVAHPALPAASVKELVALARRRPGQITFASTSTGSMPHLAGEQFKAAAGIDITHVPFKGAAPAVTDVVAGHVQILFADLPILLPQVKGGKLRPLVLASNRRHPLLPDIPTTAETGMPGVLADNWYGVMVPVKTPAAIVARLNQSLVKTLQDPAVRTRLADQGAEATGGTPEQFAGSEQFAGFIRTEAARWGQVVKAAGLKPE
ncbi:MAG: tripartite tricarboxylate transporter substrate binding protein [Betaproteobacteria bacterium]|jgi:tripartite-type tricarboxylate transporter receptor subunit TctC|nr:tripartite tricarboxylate transporter substrate binding protein [Betaproteobacteria bacterium]